MFYMFLLSAEAVARAVEAPAAAAAVAQQVEQDHAPAPAHQPAGLGVGGLGAVGLAGVLHPAQVHLVLGVVRVQLHGAAGILQSVHTFAKPLIGQRGEIVPPRVAAGHAVQHPAGLGVAAVHDEVAGGLHLGAVGAVVAGTALLLVAAKVEPETERVEIKAAKIGIAVVLAAVIAVLLVAALLLIIAVGVAVALLPVTIAAGLLLGLFFICLLYTSPSPRDTR